MTKIKLSVMLVSLLMELALILGGWGPSFSSVYAAGIRYAAPTAQGSGDCSSWANACTLQTALSGATSGDEIWVKTGVHKPGPSSDRTASFQLKNGVAVYGGFAGTETSRDQRNWVTNKTILSGDIDNNDTNTDGNNIAERWTDIQGYNSHHVVTGSVTDNTAVMDGFIITAGQANGGATNYYGGGMYNNTDSPSLTNVTFSGNYAYYGGGMYNTNNSSPALTNVTFSGNYAYVDGGGMYNYSSSPTLTNVTFSGNQATTSGGGMFNITNSNPTLTNVTFSGNQATTSGGGMFNSLSNPTLKNVIMWGNTASSGAGIYNGTSTPNISYSLLQESSCPSGATCGSGMLYATDPLFVDANGADNTLGTLDDDLRLRLASPAIDTGTTCSSTDIDGLSRPTDGNGDGTSTCDMGAYEFGIMVSVAPNNTYTFDCATNSQVSITTGPTLGSMAYALIVQRNINHPNATPPIQTGRYWEIRGLQGDKQSDATGFTVDLTLPATFIPDGNDKICRYTGSGWDCAVNSYTSTSLTRRDITSFSDWAVGNDVGPSAVELQMFTATTTFATPQVLLMLFVGWVAVGLVMYWFRKSK